MFAGKTALVTGSTSGIGLGIALRLAQLGARLMINGLGDAEGALAQVRAHDPRAVHHGADMSRPDQIAAMVRSCEAQLGGCDILVNNAGIQHVANVEAFPAERWDAIIAINLSSAFHTMHAALPGMQARNWGRIINVASVHGLVASAGKSAYVAAKHGLIGLTKAAALENATTGVTVNAICPGWVLTPLVQKQVDARAAADGVDDAEAQRRLLAEKQPSLQFTTPAELAELVVFLCSPAAQNVRGVAWNVDGGWIAQ
ncbi:MAG: 3-hydroxybutyrate dehydrogenase [Burkholderiales bacterium]|nr:3-hydroxybutyrate dehydrogenase [Burkholderiales bacterium]MDE1927325.1 3-hydroxybutyrate dehydrogenase [Burkholderiales bacterium]MDE2160912.1 3-hydroxybutyrate dehydrogenase [Burkholderiales bacterium]MDE2501801.1 3-hydroxybutyrate dehydrogenase [Burkholderiales bacterium]